MSNKSHICDDVMKQIETEHITMRPKLYFLFGSFLVGTGMAGAVVTSIFFTHVTLHRLQSDALFDYLDFGSSGLQPFITVFPWVPFMIAVVGLLGGSYLMHEYEMPNKYRYKRFALMFAAIVLTLGFLLDRTGIRRQIMKVTPLRSWYEYEYEHRPYLFGEVLEVNKDRAIILTPSRKKVYVSLRSIKDDLSLNEGSLIRALGAWEKEVFYIHHLLVK